MNKVTATPVPNDTDFTPSAATPIADGLFRLATIDAALAGAERPQKNQPERVRLVQNHRRCGKA